MQRKPDDIAGALRAKLGIAQRMHAQVQSDKNKLYALHAPEAECITKGKARTPYGFGVKVSVTVTANWNRWASSRAQTPKIVLADRGYRGVESPGAHGC